MCEEADSVSPLMMFLDALPLLKLNNPLTLAGVKDFIQIMIDAGADINAKVSYVSS